MALTLRDGLALACAALAALAIGAAAWLVISPGTPSTDAGVGRGVGDPSLVAGLDPSAATGQPSPSGEILVDVQGGVVQPGVVRLAGGSRVADAIAAAGGYSELADLLAAAASINLAGLLADGQQVFVPIAGMNSAGGGPGPDGDGGSGGSGDGLVNLNTASPEALEALPGIGPVTVQKIVAARQERPFATLDELVARKVMNNGQLDGIRDLVTV